MTRGAASFSLFSIIFREPFPAHADLSRLQREFLGEAGEACGAEGPKDRDPRRDARQKAFVIQVKHYLGRLRLLQRPKLIRLFHSSAADAKCLKADPIMRWVACVCRRVLWCCT